MKSTNSPLLTRKQAAEYLRVQPNTLANWVSTGRYDLPLVKIGRKAMYRLTDLDAFIARNRVTNVLGDN